MPNNSSNGSIFEAFSISDQINYTPLSFKGEYFAPDLISSISALLWHHWHEIAVLWFLLEVFFIIYSSSKRLVFVDISGINASKEEKENYQSAGLNLTNLFATKMDRINQIYRIVDEKRPIQSACGAGEPIEAAIKAGNLDDVSLSSIPDLSLGPMKIPIQSISNILSHILGSPKIVLDLHHRKEIGISVDKENNDSTKEKTSLSGKKSEWFLTASMSGREGLRTWLVDSPDSLEEEANEKGRSVEDIVTEMAHRIYTSLQADATGESINWRAMWKFNEGLRAYRDCLNTTRKHKYYLSMAEKSLMDAIEEQNNFSLAYYNLGVVYAELNQLNASESCFQKAVASDPQLWEAYYAQGIASYRQGKELDDLHDYLDLDIKEGAKRQIAGEYKKAILLCQRILDIKFDQEGIFKKDFSRRAKVFDLEGNARARLACIKCKKGSICDSCNEVDPEELKRAIASLEISVHNSWMALIKESVLNETVEDESKIVSECSLDLAYLYLKMYRHLNPRKAILLSNAASVLRQAIYINPDDANLYHLLGSVSKRMDSEYYFTKKIYDYALRIKPESSRLKANLFSVKSDNNAHDYNVPSSWLETCENSGCMDEEIHESFFRLLARAIEEEYKGMKIDPSLCNCLKVLCEKQRSELDLKRVSEKGERAISLLQQKKCDCQWERDPDLCMVLLRLAKDFDDIYADCKCLLSGLYMLGKSEILSTKKEDAKKVLSANVVDEVARLELADYFFRLGLISFEFGKARAEVRAEANAEKCSKARDIQKRDMQGNELYNSEMNYLDQSRDCFRLLMNVLSCSKYDPKASSEDNHDDKEGRDTSSVESDKTDKECWDSERIVCNIRNLCCSFSNLYKIKSAHYLIESGKALLDLGTINKSYKQYYEPAIPWDGFYWNELRENISILKGFVNQCFYIEWMEYLTDNEKELTDSGIILRYRDNCLSLKKENAKVFLRVDDGRTREFRTENKNDGIRIYGGSSNCYECFLSAKQAFKQAMALLENVDPEEIGHTKIRLQIARANQACGKLHEALKEAQIARSENPLDHEVLTVLGEIFCELKEFRFGLAELENAISCKPDDPDLLLKVGRAYLSAGRDCWKGMEDRKRLLEKSQEYLEEALQIEDRSRIKKRGKIRYWIGKTLIEMGRYDEAIPHLRILSQPPEEEPLARLCLGYAYCKNNVHEEGERILFDLIRSFNDREVAFGRNFDDYMDANELIAKAHIYLAYSYALRDANLHKSWILASWSQTFIDKIIDKEDIKWKRSIDPDGPNSFDLSLSWEDHLGSVPEPCKAHTYYGEPFSLGNNEDNHRYHDHAVFVMNNYMICVHRCNSDGPKKRKARANLAECAGLICRKMGYFDEAIEFLEVSISLFPDAEAYLSLAKAYHGKLLQEMIPDPRKALIDRKILDLCQHVQELDVRQKYGHDLEEFKKSIEKKPSAPATGGATATDKPNK